MKKLNYLFKFMPSEGRWLVIVIALLISVIVIYTSGLLSADVDERYVIEKGKVLSANDEKLSSDPYIEDMNIGRQFLEVEILTGKYKGRIFQVENNISRFYNWQGKENMTMLFSVREENGKLYSVDMYGYNRGEAVLGLVGVFFLILILVGRKKGLYSILSLMFTMIIIIFFMLPMVLKGYSPILLAIITSCITTVVTITLVSGVNTKSLAAIIGIVLGVATAGIISFVAGKAAHLSGINMDEASEMIFLAQDIGLKVPDLLFAGIIIASLGAIMDVGMTIASAVYEVYSVNTKLSLSALYKSGMNVGRDAMGTMSNTLILAFAGGSINTLIIIILYKLPSIRLFNLDLVGIELIQGISGSIGIIFTVPITALCASYFATRQNKMHK